jgi:hypothetical protein
MIAANMITPLVACLDPLYKFPIFNGEEGVTRRLRRLGLINRDLRDRLAGFIGLIGQFGLSDAFAVDTMTDEQIDKIKKEAVNASRVPVQAVNEAPLPPFDDAERQAVQKSQTITYRRRHNRIITAHTSATSTKSGTERRLRPRRGRSSRQDGAEPLA